MNKDEILDILEDSREVFLEAIDGLPDEALLEPGVVGEWSIKDIIVHLSMWEAELVKLLWQAGQGQTPTTAHFSGAQVDDLNAAWQASGQERPLERALEDFEGVRKQTVRRVMAFSEQELSDPKHYPWQRDYPLSEWIENDSFGHESEHTAEIQAWRARRGL
jgi:hypothetical protein